MKEHEFEQHEAAIARMDAKQLNRIVDALKHRRKILRLRSTRKFSVGDMVQFKDRKGVIKQGRITKVNRVTCKVRVDGVLWTVTSTLLTHV